MKQNAVMKYTKPSVKRSDHKLDRALCLIRYASVKARMVRSKPIAATADVNTWLSEQRKHVLIKNVTFRKMWLLDCSTQVCSLAFHETSSRNMPRHRRAQCARHRKQRGMTTLSLRSQMAILAVSGFSMPLVGDEMGVNVVLFATSVWKGTTV